MYKRQLLFLFQISLSEETSTTHCNDGTDEYCGACLANTSSQSGCAVCINSYQENNDNICKEPSTLIEGCFNYDSSTQECAACNKPLYLDESKKCVETTLSNCVHQKDATTCLECNGFFVKEDGTCDAAKACTIEGCSSCKTVDEKDVCTVCKSAFVLSQTDADPPVASCLKLVSSLDGCSVALNGKCVACKYGYYLNSKLGADEFKCKRTYKYNSIRIVSDFLFIVFSLIFMLAK